MSEGGANAPVARTAGRTERSPSEESRTLSRTVFAVIPAGIDDPDAPSGGNIYDRRVLTGLARRGWTVHELAASTGWPEPPPAARAALAATLESIPDGAVVLMDGMVASAAPEVLLPHSARLRTVVLVHLPLAETQAPMSVLRGERAVLRAAAAVVTTSGWTRRRMHDRYGLSLRRLHVARPGVDSAGRPGSNPGPATNESVPRAGALLCVAPVAPHKGHDLLITALAALRDMDWTCRCVGSLTRDPTFATQIRDQADRAGIGGRLSLAGPLSSMDLDREYENASVLVHPSRGETYGMVLAEAISHGVPVIAADVGGVREAVDDEEGGSAGLLVRADDPSALAAALRRWLGEPELRRDLINACLARRVTLPDWASTVDDVERVLTGVAA